MYESIGQALVDEVGDSFERVLVRVEMADGVGSVGVFVGRGGTYWYRTDEHGTLFDLFAGLRGAARAAGSGEWSQATFELTAGGRFRIDYGFADISDWGQASARREEWLARHLGPQAQVIWS